MSLMVDGNSYDDVQRNAILTRCLRCGRKWWMVLARFVCVECRRWPT